MTPRSYLSPRQAGQLSKRARQLHRARRISDKAFAQFEHMLWSARRPGRTSALISYSGMQRIAAASRSAVAANITALERAGLLRRETHRQCIRGFWRQATSEYHFALLAPESGDQPVSKRDSLSSFTGNSKQHAKDLELPSGSAMIEAALARMATAIAGRMQP